MNFELKTLLKEGFNDNEILDILHCEKTNPTITFINERIDAIIIYTSINTVEEIHTILDNVNAMRDIEHYTLQDIRIRDVEYLEKLANELEGQK